MARRVHTGCRDCKRCTNSAIADAGRAVGRGTANLATLGLASAVTKKCRACGHAMSLHGHDDRTPDHEAPQQDRRAPDPDKPLLLQPTLGALISEAKRRRKAE